MIERGATMYMGGEQFRGPCRYRLWRGRFVMSSATILVVTGMAKIWAAMGDVTLLTVSDPVFGVPFKSLMLAVAVVELAVAIACLLFRPSRLPVHLVAGLASGFLIYRIGLWWMDWVKPCSCLGNLTDALRLTPQTADLLVKVLLVYLLTGSYALMLWERRRPRLGRVRPTRSHDPDRSGERGSFAGMNSVRPIAGIEEVAPPVLHGRVRLFTRRWP